jgi:formate-dependent nitrite reductase membrane component NrfD
MPGVTTDLVRRSMQPAQAAPRDIMSPQAPQSEPSYYDLSFLQAPVWKWEIASYFFFGGVSAGAYLIARMADRFGGDEHRDIARFGSFISLAALLPCPPLLIADLGDPKRFHHMLRVWKPGTPMNLGSWTLTGFGAASTLAALRQWAKGRSRRDRTLAGRMARLLRTADEPIALFNDMVGVPLALMFSGYTGVLISCTANPLWCKNPWLGAMFTANAIGAAASCVSLALMASGASPDGPAHRAVEKIDTAAAVIDLVCTGGYLRHAGENARPLTHGKYKHHLYLGVGGLVAAEVIKRLPVRGNARKLTSVAAAAMTIASAYSLKWAMTYAGHDAAKDPRLARNISRGTTPARALPPAGAQPTVTRPEPRR